jgi:putative lipoic acid-binding regulatory protein
MSIFDKPQRLLNQAIFDENEKVLPNVKQHIMKLLISFFPEDKIHSVVFQGSNTTHQYAPDSDIDVQIMATKNEEFDTWHPAFKNFNKVEHLLPGTKHPINFFFIEYIPPEKIVRGWERSLGAYDLLVDEWLKKSTPYAKIKDPEVEYASEIAYVKMMMVMIEGEIDAVRTAIEKKDRERAMMGLDNLQKFFRQIDNDSKDSYRWGAGIPNKEEDHVILKLLSKGPYGDLLKDLIG